MAGSTTAEIGIASREECQDQPAIAVVRQEWDTSDGGLWASFESAMSSERGSRTISWSSHLWHQSGNTAQVDVLALWQHLQSMFPHAQSKRHNAWLLRGRKRWEHCLRNPSTGRCTARRGQREHQKVLAGFPTPSIFSSLPECLLENAAASWRRVAAHADLLTWCWSSVHRSGPLEKTIMSNTIGSSCGRGGVPFSKRMVVSLPNRA